MTGSDASSQLIRNFGDAIAATLGAITGQAISVTMPPVPDAAEAGSKDWQQDLRTAQGQVLGILSVSGSGGFSAAAGSMMLESAGLDDSTPEEIGAAWQEVAGQILGQFVSALNAASGHELTLGPGTEEPHDAAHRWAEIGIQGPRAAWRVLVTWPPALAQLVAPAPAAPVAAGAVATSGTFEVLLDVALPVAVSFGRTALQIREVLKLNTGSIIELNRLITEPVDVVVNDCVIARGEVVVVDGNYGVRITQIASREDRVRTGVGGAEIFPSGVAA